MIGASEEAAIPEISLKNNVGDGVEHELHIAQEHFY